MTDYSHLPGGDFISRGLLDHSEGKITPESCLIEVGRPRLARSGIAIGPRLPLTLGDPHRQLYHLLLQLGGDAYSRYNALLRRLISFEQANEALMAKTAKP
jgi:hypothetical protein